MRRLPARRTRVPWLMTTAPYKRGKLRSPRHSPRRRRSGIPVVGGGTLLALIRWLVPRQVTCAKSSGRGQEMRLRATRKPAASPSTPHLPLPGRTRGAPRSTCAPKRRPWSGSQSEVMPEGRRTVRKLCPPGVSARAARPQPDPGCSRACGAAPPPGAARPQSHLWPQPPLPPPSQEPPGRLRSPGAGGMESSGPALRRSGRRPRSGDAGAQGSCAACRGGHHRGPWARSRAARDCRARGLGLACGGAPSPRKGPGAGRSHGGTAPDPCGWRHGAERLARRHLEAFWKPAFKHRFPRSL